jgi:hypothetical protein
MFVRMESERDTLSQRKKKQKKEPHFGGGTQQAETEKIAAYAAAPRGSPGSIRGRIDAGIKCVGAWLGGPSVVCAARSAPLTLIRRCLDEEGVLLFVVEEEKENFGLLGAG